MSRSGATRASATDVDVEPAPALLARIEAAVSARERLRRRPLADTIVALVAAATRWRDDEGLRATLPAHAGLSSAMLDAHLPAVADALDADVMTQLVERAWGPGAASRPAGAGPGVVAHVLASNVPALALPAMTLGCLSGAAVVLKSGRHDPLSAPAFHRALAAVDRALAATIVTTYWPGGDRAREDAVLGRADVVVATGGEVAVAALRRVTRARLLAHGPRWSIAVVGDGERDLAAVAAAAACDVATWDQRGCLSPHVVYVAGSAARARAFATLLANALAGEGRRLPPGNAPLDERAALHGARADAEWHAGVTVLGGASGTVFLHATPTAFVPTPGGRTVRVSPVPTLAALLPLLPAGAIECVGLAGIDPLPFVADFRARGVARLCRVGDMQRPPLTWPRGQQPALGTLLRADLPPAIEVEPCLTT